MKTNSNCKSLSVDPTVVSMRMNKDGDALKHMKQHQAETDPESEIAAILAAEGLACDQLPGATGAFGSPGNPVPVAAWEGMVNYLRDLRGREGQRVVYTSTGFGISNQHDTLIKHVDIWTEDGKQKALISFSRFHPRNSTLAPEGFHLVGGTL